jgi:hypothetical protein
MSKHTTRPTNSRRSSASSDATIQRLCLIVNNTWPQSDEYLAQAVAEARDGMTLDEFHALAREVAAGVWGGGFHPEADFVHRVQQRAFRIKYAEEGVEPPERR